MSNDHRVWRLPLRGRPVAGPALPPACPLVSVHLNLPAQVRHLPTVGAQGDRQEAVAPARSQVRAQSCPHSCLAAEPERRWLQPLRRAHVDPPRRWLRRCAVALAPATMCSPLSRRSCRLGGVRWEQEPSLVPRPEQHPALLATCHACSSSSGCGESRRLEGVRARCFGRAGRT